MNNLDWLERLNQSLNYLEDHLDQEISYQEIAKIACCSSYHYQRMFSYIADVSLGEYIRRRKMSLAAVDLQNGGKVIDVAIKYGYDSPTSFNRAFKKIQGMTPQQAKDSDTKLLSYPKLNFSIQIKGVAAMTYKIVEKEQLRFIGKKVTLGPDIETAMQEIPKFWQKLSTEGDLEKLFPLIQPEFPAVYGISISESVDQKQWDYMIGVQSDQKLSGFDEYYLPAAKWAIFDGTGEMPTGIQELNKQIYTEWLPTSGFEYANLPILEAYLNNDPVHSEFQVWLPVK